MALTASPGLCLFNALGTSWYLPTYMRESVFKDIRGLGFKDKGRMGNYPLVVSKKPSCS